MVISSNYNSFFNLLFKVVSPNCKEYRAREPERNRKHVESACKEDMIPSTTYLKKVPLGIGD